MFTQALTRRRDSLIEVRQLVAEARRAADLMQPVAARKARKAAAEVRWQFIHQGFARPGRALCFAPCRPRVVCGGPQSFYDPWQQHSGLKALVQAALRPQWCLQSRGVEVLQVNVIGNLLLACWPPVAPRILCRRPPCLARLPHPCVFLAAGRPGHRGGLLWAP